MTVTGYILVTILSGYRQSGQMFILIKGEQNIHYLFVHTIETRNYVRCHNSSL